jgi:hypothetical protein
VGTFTEIDRLHGENNARTGRDLDHRREAEARIARSTVVSVLPSMPGATHTTAPASLTSITGGTDAAGAEPVSVIIGTKVGSGITAGSLSLVVRSLRASRRHVKTCCELSCQRRATSETRAPGASVSSMIRAFSSDDQRRRRPGPVSSSIRRYPPFVSSLMSTMMLA